MTINITIFSKINVIDTCAIWNLISCNLFYSRAIESQCFFSLTRFVEYECLLKKRHAPTASELQMQGRLRQELAKGKFRVHTLSVADIQDIQILDLRKKLGMGELSSIAFAKKINQCFLTDDQPARRFASPILGNDKVQTVPQLLGFLIYKRIITDGEVDEIIKDHSACGRTLEQYFREVKKEALRIMLQS
jgi:predicted nucleic acid-binding protein